MHADGPEPPDAARGSPLDPDGRLVDIFACPL